MAHTYVDVDESACSIVMGRYGFTTQQEAVNYALRAIAGEALDLDAARSLRGSGWDDDLKALRSSN
jgi:Arc/MetJ family transcription regulator